MGPQTGYPSMSSPTECISQASAAVPGAPRWRVLCRERGLDVAEVEMVSARYRAYRSYMAPKGGGLPLEDWFRYYRMEKASDSGVGAIGDCSATGEAPEHTALSNPGGFLEVLREQLATVGDG